LGDHNRYNACLALSAALRFGLQVADVQTRLSAICALPHRLQTVVKRQGITCIDDSIATTPPSAIAALQAISGPLSIILGGSDKGADFGALALAVQQRGAKVVLIGQVKPRLMQALDAIAYPYHSAESMAQAVQTCKTLLPGTGTILLSPACASFGMFTCFEERGDCFSAACKQLFRE
jgi:UDP-N-acetylmuramoylalanine--D-glutamate ligase